MMGLFIATKEKPGGQSAVGRYLTAIRDALAKRKFCVAWTDMTPWTGKRPPGNPATDLVIVDNQDATAIPAAYAVLAVQHGCAMEDGLRGRASDLLALGRKQAMAARRKRTAWVACSDWAAYHCRQHTGTLADRIIYGCVDTERFFPSERQRTRDAKRPVVLHDCADVVVGKVTAELGKAFEVRALAVPAGKVPDAMREADIWLCLSLSEGLPTVVMEAQATGLVVVGTNVGVLWPHTGGARLDARDKGVCAAVAPEQGAVIFDWKWRDSAAYVADWVRAAWGMRKSLNARDWALRWYGQAAFGQKWLEAIAAAARRFGIEGAGASPPKAPVETGGARRDAR